MIWFTADQHFEHDNIIEYEDRPWKNMREMEKGITEIYNSIVTPDDEVWHLGDLSLVGPENVKFYDRIIGNLNGHKHLVLGQSHDRCKPFYYVNRGFISVHTAIKLNVGRHDIICAHDPAVWNALPNKDEVIFLCAHVHKFFKSIKERKTVNVGVDVWDFKPVSLAEILGELE
jgi:calcineurin-like phosphoesterase family protein